jgi:hypothetical protein
VGELVPEQHRTSRSDQVAAPDEAMQEEKVASHDDLDDKANKRLKSTQEDWENEQVQLISKY